MNGLNSPISRLRRYKLIAVLAATTSAALIAMAGTETTTAPETAPGLTGAQLYAINCNRCHAERYPTEWTSAQWKTLMLHMRVRANLPGSQAKLILKYLQEESGS